MSTQRFTKFSSFNVRCNRFSETGPIFKSNNIDTVNIGVGFESKNDKTNFFTNYLNSDKQDNYIRMCKLYTKIISNDTSFIDKDYICDEIYDNGKAVERLISIINYNNNLNLSKKDINHIFKLKAKDNRKIHIYISYENDCVTLILIDLYHLSIPSDVYKNRKLVKRGSLDETRRIYNTKYESCSYNLNNIVK